jgi:hypothetical protein
MAPTTATFLQARMRADAKAQILKSGDYARATEIAMPAGYSENNPSAQPGEWKREQAIFVIKHNGVDHFPLYGLNPEKSDKPYPDAVRGPYRVSRREKQLEHRLLV